MSETASLNEEETGEFIGINSDYVVLTNSEDNQDSGQESNVIVLSEGQNELVAHSKNENVLVTNDGQVVVVEEICDDESNDHLIFQREEVVIDEPEQKQSIQLIVELEAKRKRLNLPKVPKKFLLFDGICAEIVDYDEEDGAPYVEFSMVVDDRELDRLPVECGICPDIMHRSKLEAHLKTHIKPGKKRFTCIYCEEDFVTRAYAAGHARRHKGIRPYVCVPCKLYYCTKQDLKVHEQRRHLAKEHVCELCGKTFAQNTSLKHHRMLVHEQKRNWECELCGKRFLRKYAMNEHVRNVHYGDRRLLDCPFCDMNFKDTHKLAQHRKDMHLSQDSFECRICGMEFSHIDFFDAHRRSLQCREKLKRHIEQQQYLEHYRIDEDHLLEEYEQEIQNANQQIDQQQEHLEQVVVEEITHEMNDEEEDVENTEEDMDVNDREKAKAEQQLLYEIAAMDQDV